MDDGEIVELINNLRQNYNLKPLKPNPRLKQSSQLKVEDMVQQAYFAHTGPTGEPFHMNVRRASYPYRAVGEVLARNGSNGRVVLEAWLSSPRHRAMLLDPGFEDISCSNSTSARGSLVACHLGKPGL